MDNLNNKLKTYVMDPKYPLHNFNLAREYELLEHNASALSFYLRCAELSNDDDLTYETLLRMCICVEKQRNRVYSLKGMLHRAISFQPERPEAYFIMARVCEFNKFWQESYMYANIGLNYVGNAITMMTDIGYPEGYGLMFQKAVAAWWIGLYDESIYLFRQLNKRTDLRSDYKNSVINNLNQFALTSKKEIRYHQGRYNELRLKFPGARDIEENYSQCYQDMFVLTMLEGKREGLFLEIGCGDPIENSNTYLLEKQFGWSGLSFDINESLVDRFNSNRKYPMHCEDATRIDFYNKLSIQDYDYLQIDCDPAESSFKVLQRIPFETIRFAVITFEHDAYNSSSDVRYASRQYLKSFGYVMVVGNISHDRFSPFEDWWVHPDLVDQDRINRMKCWSMGEICNKADLYMLNKI